MAGAIVRLLIEEGYSVRSFARHVYPDLDALGVEQIQGDLDDAAMVSRAVAWTVTWFSMSPPKRECGGAFKDYYRPNVLGTAHVVDACREHAGQAPDFYQFPQCRVQRRGYGRG